MNLPKNKYEWFWCVVKVVGIMLGIAAVLFVAFVWTLKDFKM